LFSLGGVLGDAWMISEKEKSEVLKTSLLFFSRYFFRYSKVKIL
jgi:hypothetical protein